MGLKVPSDAAIAEYTLREDDTRNNSAASPDSTDRAETMFIMSRSMTLVA